MAAQGKVLSVPTSRLSLQHWLGDCCQMPEHADMPTINTCLPMRWCQAVLSRAEPWAH